MNESKDTKINPFLENKINEYESIVNEIENILSIDHENLEIEALRNMKIFPAIERIYLIQFKEYRNLLETQDKVKFERWKYYSGGAPPETYKKEPLRHSISKSDIEKYMSVDPKVRLISDLVSQQEKILKFLEDAKKHLNSRGWDIKNAIDYIKFRSGA